MSSSTKEVPVETDLAVRRLVARYAHLLDDRDFGATAELMTDDGRVIVNGVSHTGRPAVRAWLEGSYLPAVHLMTNVVVSYGSQPGTAHAVSDVVLLDPVEGHMGIVATGRYHDTVAGDGRSWRYSQRIIKLRPSG
ncbi:MAG: nuclear transport factor 2 family protein [Acidimicrobiales bacterium]